MSMGTITWKSQLPDDVIDTTPLTPTPPPPPHPPLVLILLTDRSLVLFSKIGIESSPITRHTQRYVCAVAKLGSVCRCPGVPFPPRYLTSLQKSCTLSYTLLEEDEKLHIVFAQTSFSPVTVNHVIRIRLLFTSTQFF